MIIIINDSFILKLKNFYFFFNGILLLFYTIWEYDIIRIIYVSGQNLKSKNTRNNKTQPNTSFHNYTLKNSVI